MFISTVWICDLGYTLRNSGFKGTKLQISNIDPKSDKYFIKLCRTKFVQNRVVNKINISFCSCMAPLASYRFGP